MLTNSSTVDPYHTKVYFKYQSHRVSFQEWILIFTTCLAPLITHIVFGYSAPVLLAPNPPRWRDRLSQFNPLTILWRWYAIVYRRCRARHWDAADLAASNAIFWNGSRWDGSEDLMLTSREWLIKKPTKTHARLVSASTVATTVMTLQGVAAMLEIRSSRGDWHTPVLTLPQLFYPIAVLSFARLPASTWLSSDYTYNPSDTTAHHSSLDPISTPTDDNNGLIRLAIMGKAHISPLGTCGIPILDELPRSPILQSRLLPPTTVSRLWAGLAILVAPTGCVFGILLSVLHAGPHLGVLVSNSSSLCVRALYFTLSLPSAAIFAFYAWKGHATNTALPCMNSTWYKWYSGLLITEALLAIIFLALETAVLADGTITTYRVPPGF